MSYIYLLLRNYVLLFLSVFLLMPFGAVKGGISIERSEPVDCHLVPDKIRNFTSPSPIQNYEAELQETAKVLSEETKENVEARAKTALWFINSYCAVRHHLEGEENPNRKKASFVADLITEDLVRNLLTLGLESSDVLSERRKNAILFAGAALEERYQVLKEHDPLSLKAVLKLNIIEGKSNKVASTFDALIQLAVAQVETEDPDDDKEPAAVIKRLTKLTEGLDLREAAEKMPLAFHDLLFSLLPPKLTDYGIPCMSGQSSGGKKRALLIGNDDYQKVSDLKGSLNAVELIKRSLEQRGFDDIRVLSNATRRQIIDGMYRLARDTQCRDFVFLHFTGRGGKFIYQSHWLPGWSFGLMGVDLDRTQPRAVLGAEISQWMTGIRNRRGNVVVSLDISNAAGLSLQRFQKLAQPLNYGWSGKAISDGNFEVDKIELDFILPLEPEGGGFAAFYAADSSSSGVADGVELPPLRKGSSGEFAALLPYSLAKSLQTLEKPAISELAESISRIHAEYKKDPYFADPVFEASNPNMCFGLLSDTGHLEVAELEFDILAPKKLKSEAMRGVSIALNVKKNEFDFTGLLKDPRRYANITVNHKPVTLMGGQFTTKVALKPGQNTVTVTAIERKTYQFHTKTLEFDYDGDLEQFLGDGRRYALVIGIEEYRDKEFPLLTTPIEDAKEVAKILKEQYGFQLQLDVGKNEPIDLILLNATNREINISLNELRRRLTEKDALLIYFAGHGIYDEDADEAFWIASDSELDVDYTYVSSNRITKQLKKMSARNALLVSDSCYSGAMSRAAPDLTYFDKENRRRALLKAGEKRSRVLISSGGNEPVLDKGGSGHSIFARAFLDGLKKMEKSPFTARELLMDHIYVPVSGQTRQEPQHKEIRDSGHEGGDFVFARVGSK